MTKLDAVNAVLRASRHLPVPALDTLGGSLASEAERAIDEQELEIQQEEWNYNHRYNVTLTPDGSGYITMPAGCVWIDGYGSCASWGLTTVGEKLYDTDTNSDVFESNVIVHYRLRYEWGCIPLHVRSYIAASAAADFNQSWGKPHLQQKLDEKRLDRRTRARQLDEDQQDTNTLDTLLARGIRGGRRGNTLGSGIGDSENYA